MKTGVQALSLLLDTDMLKAILVNVVHIQRALTVRKTLFRLLCKFLNDWNSDDTLFCKIFSQIAKLYNIRSARS